ncbi:hypothetical protein ADK57_30555 [Streptomyces sp. MMG1533]|nr:hypothetical protein ADK57_30555 [Streptomyces sp. MMG1533]
MDGVAGGEGEVVEVSEDGLLDLLAGGRDDPYVTDPRAARARTGRRDVDVDRGGRGGGRVRGALLVPLLVAAESSHLFPHSDASGSRRTTRSDSMVLPPASGFRTLGARSGR